jgi:hypothetical protein
VPGGVTVLAGGKVSLLRVAVQPKENRLWINYATKPDQNGPEMATHLLVSGFTQPPRVVRNGIPFAGPFWTTYLKGRFTYLVALNSN